MRPGREAPENDEMSTTVNNMSGASMRPGREAPENAERMILPVDATASFNEAGARSPGKRYRGIHSRYHASELQ